MRQAFVWGGGPKARVAQTGAGVDRGMGRRVGGIDRGMGGGGVGG